MLQKRTWFYQPITKSAYSLAVSVVDGTNIIVPNLELQRRAVWDANSVTRVAPWNFCAHLNHNASLFFFHRFATRCHIREFLFFCIGRSRSRPATGCCWPNWRSASRRADSTATRPPWDTCSGTCTSRLTLRGSGTWPMERRRCRIDNWWRSAENVAIACYTTNSVDDMVEGRFET